MEQKFDHDHFWELFVEGARKLGFDFPPKTLDKFLSYYRELSQWEKLLNITSLKGEKEKIVLLFLDSLAGSFAFRGEKYRDLIDIGTGGGFPGIPLKLAFPEIKLSLLESKAKKTTFLLNLIGQLDLSDVTVIQDRLEKIEPIRVNGKKWDMATIKGVNIDHVIRYMKNILQENGKLVVFRSKKFENPGIIHDMVICHEIEYELPFGFGNRVISVFRFLNH